MTKLTNFQRQVLIGLLLGNGSLQNMGKNYRFRFIQSAKRKDYVFHVYEIFKDFIGTPPKLVEEVRSNSLKKVVIYKKWYFNTLTNPCFRPYYDLFYKEGKKVITNEVIDLLDRESLAYWFMDNGSRKGKTSEGFRLCTDFYSLEEVLNLQKVLNDKFRLETSIARQKQSYRIYIKAKSHQDFVLLIKDLLINSMKYLIV